MMNRKAKQAAAVLLSASMVFGTGAFAQNIDESEDKGSVSLSIAGNDEADVDQEEETQEQTEEATEAKVVYDQLETTNSGDAQISAVDVSAVVADVMPSIVAITTTSVQEVRDYFYGSSQYTVQSAGSGIIIAQNDEELLIATNYHVVEDASTLTVEFSVDADSEEELLAEAVVKGTSSDNDLAVVAVKLADINEDIFSQLKIATLGSSSDLKVGEAAIVIGNAMGRGQTVTTGVVSALEREVTTELGTFSEVQVDAGVNSGCSGGAILNSKGEVIAITEAKSNSAISEAMGYGIPIDTAIPVLEELINRQTRQTVENHGYLGITVVPISDEAQEMYGMPAGAYVYSVSEGSGAEAAGIQKGDIIVSFDGIAVSDSTELVDLITYYEPGETVTVEIASAQNGEYVTTQVEVTLNEAAAVGYEESDDDVQQMPDGNGQDDLFGGDADDDSDGTW